MAVTDDFDRATLGANWTTPGIPGTPTYWDGSVEIMASPYGAAQPELAAIAGGDYCIALYTGDGEFSTNQYAELELVGDFDFESYTAVYNDYGSVGLLLNAPDPAGAAGTINTTLLRMHAFNYSAYGSYYYDKHLYVDLVSYVGGVALENREWIQPPGGQFLWDYNEFFTDLRIPSGTKVALQRRNNIYTVHLYSPDTSQWYKLFDAESDRGGSSGYPGIYVTSYNGQENARITNFRAGGDGDVFPDGSPGTASGLSRTISRSTTRDIESSTDGKIRNLGSGGGGGSAAVPDFTGVSYAGLGDGNTSVTVSHTSTADHQGFLIIGSVYRNASKPTISTWDGVAPTEVHYSTGGVDQGDMTITCWAVLNPTAQTANITLTEYEFFRPLSVLVIPFTTLDTASAATDVFEVSASYLEPLVSGPYIDGFTCSGTADRLHMWIDSSDCGDSPPNYLVPSNTADYSVGTQKTTGTGTGNNAISTNVWTADALADSDFTRPATTNSSFAGVIFAVGGG